MKKNGKIFHDDIYPNLGFWNKGRNAEIMDEIVHMATRTGYFINKAKTLNIKSFSKPH